MAYRARKESDGFYSILGVPVFAEVPKGVKGAPYDIDREWLDAALVRSRTREKEGYLAPLHFEHHDGGERNFKAGHYRLSRVGTLKVGGETKAVLYADLVKLPAHVFSAIMANEWPFRSVEIVRYQDHEIESVALLDDDTPFHKFELLNADSIELEEDDSVDAVAPVWGPVAFAKTPRGHAALFRFSEDRMKINITGNPKKGFQILGEDGKPLAATSGATATFSPTDGYRFASDDDDLPDDEEKLKKMAKSISAKLAKMAKAGGKHSAADGDTEPGRHEPAEAKQLAEFAARLDTLEGEIKRRDDADAARSRVEDAAATLKKDGFHVSDLTRSTMAKFAADKTAFEGFVAHYRATARKDGPESPGGSDKPAADPAVAKFAAMGEDAHRTAVAALAAFKELVDAGMRRGTDEERSRFVASYCAARGFKAA